MLRHIIVLLLALAITGCSDPKSMPLPSDINQISQDQKLIEQIKTMDQADKDLFAAFLARATISQVVTGSIGITPGMTVGEAIENQKSWVAQVKAEEAEAEEIRKAAIAKSNQINEQIKNTLKIVLIKVGKPTPQRYKVQLPIKFEAVNNSDKTISGYRAHVEFTDMFGKNIKNLTIEDSKGLDSQTTDQPIFVWDYNEFDDDMVKLVSLTSDNKYKATITVTHIVFQDGDELKLDI